MLKNNNHRQVDLIRHALKHPYAQYAIEAHRKSHNVVYQTDRVDLLDMAERGVWNKDKNTWAELICQR